MRLLAQKCCQNSNAQHPYEASCSVSQHIFAMRALASRARSMSRSCPIWRRSQRLWQAQRRLSGTAMIPRAMHLPQAGQLIRQLLFQSAADRQLQAIAVTTSSSSMEPFILRPVCS